MNFTTTIYLHNIMRIDMLAMPNVFFSLFDCCTHPHIITSVFQCSKLFCCKLQEEEKMQWHLLNRKWFDWRKPHGIKRIIVDKNETYTHRRTPKPEKLNIVRSFIGMKMPKYFILLICIIVAFEFYWLILLLFFILLFRKVAAFFFCSHRLFSLIFPNLFFIFCFENFASFFSPWFILNILFPFFFFNAMFFFWFLFSMNI